MKINEFNKLPNNAQLVRTDYGLKEIKEEVEEHILNKIEGWQTSNVSESEIKSLVKGIVANYERVGYTTRKRAKQLLLHFGSRHNSRKGM